MNYLVGFRIRSIVVLATLLHATAVLGKTDLDNLLFHPVPLAHAVAAPSVPAQLPADPAPDPTSLPPSPAYAAGSSATSTIDAYRAAISAAVANQGPYALSIGEDAFALGQLLAENEKPEEALEALEHSLQVLRVNHGLYDLQQVPVLRAMIRQHLAQEDVAGAHAWQEALFNLLSRHHGRDTLMQVPALIEWADWNVNLFRYEGSTSPFMTSDSDQLRMRLNNPRLMLAYTHYKAALNILQNQGALSDPRLASTERRLAALHFTLNRTVQDAVESLPSYAVQSKDFNSPIQILEQANTAHFLEGSSALRRAIAYSYNMPNPDYDVIGERMMALGDWHLLFDRRTAALEIYEDALKVMESARLPQDAVARILSSGMPVPTPDADYPEPAATSPVHAGFIDVQFELSKFGVAINPQVIGSSTDDKRITKELLRTIRNCRFRPKFVAGAAVDDEQMQLRYYFSLQEH